MKKVLLSLMALVCGMSMNAQTTGTATRTGDVSVKWVQLWENGPKFAEYNVGAENNKAEDYGGYYAWGSSSDKDTSGKFSTGAGALSGTDDTATNLWGSAWRMPTQAELQALLDNCTIEWTTVNGVNGRKFTGKGDYKSNSVFLPAAGNANNGSVNYQDYFGDYWSSTPYGSDNAYLLGFDSDGQDVVHYYRYLGQSVRAVLAENNTPTAIDDFEISLLTHAPVLPEGVKQIAYSEHGAYYHQDDHGWCWYAIEFYVDQPAEITIGGCSYQNGYYGRLTTEDGTEIAEIVNDKCDGSFTYNYTGEPQTLRLYCGQYCPFIKVNVHPETVGIEDVQNNTPATQVYYDLNGRKMKEPQRGLNIINGKTVIVK